MLQNGEISCVELTEKYLKAIEEANGELNAYVTVTPEVALEQAKQVDEKIKRGEKLLPLEGVPMTLKDNISTNGIETTCCSKILKGYKPIYDAKVWEILKKNNAILLGKTNMDEFAMGSSCETSCFGGATNPFNTDHVAGGSSGGVASAVGGDIAAFGLGSDTGGSIRQPASFCGIVGLKPTYGAVSRYGLVAYASSLDQIGPIGRDIKDCATVLETISGHDAKDSTSIKGKVLDFSKCFDGDISGMKIGIPKNYFGDGLDEDVKIPVLEAAKTLEKLGATLEEFEMPVVDYAIPTYYVVACAEASSNLSRYDGIKYGYRSPNGDNLLDVFYNSRSEGFGMEVKRRIMLGSFVLSSGYYDAYYKKGLQVRRLIKNSFADAFEKYDMILSPVAPTVAYKIGENSSDPLKMYLGDIYTVSVNLAGLPGITVPCGFGANGMPVGMQLIGDTFTEDKLVKVAYAFQKETDFHTKKGGRA